MIRFLQWPWAAVLTVVLPLLALLALSKERRSRTARLAHFGSRAMLARLAPATHRRGPLRTVRIVLACALLGFAFAGPRWGVGDTIVRREGIDIVVALDASLSMMATDENPSRLVRMKQVVRQLRALSPNDRFALLAFAGRSYILTPLTTDDGAIGLYLDNLDPSVVGQAGSSLSSAIRQAVNLLTITKSEGDRAIILLSDGEDFGEEADVRTEAKRAGDAGIELIAVGFGTERGATIPIVENGERTLKRDENGEIVTTKYSPIPLRTAAEAAGGVFIDARTANKAEAIRGVLNQLKTNPRSISTGRDFSPRFQWFVGAALLLLLIDTLSGLRTRKRVISSASNESDETPTKHPQGTVAKKTAATVSLIVVVSLVLAACGAERDPINVARYNRGTALLANDSLSAAMPVLDSASRSSNTDIRFRSAFNSGWAYLISGLGLVRDPASSKFETRRNPRRDSIPQDSLNAMLDSALARYRLALITNPDDLDAKWNYELALREQRGGGGGGGGGAGGGGGGGSATPRPQPRPSGGIGQTQADAILRNAEREERDVQGRRQRRNVPQPPPTGRDW
jgi:Ca-activated chloride channel family protein